MDSKLHNFKVDYNRAQYTLSARLRPNSDGLIVFLHGWGGAKESFADAFSSDALRDYGICAIDFVGFGQSQKPQDFLYDLQDQANIVALAINSLKAKRIYLVGHSMGGGIGLLAAPLVKNLAEFINAESNLAPKGAAADARAAARQPFWLFRSSTLPLIKAILRRHPKQRMRMWAQWFDDASPLALHRSVRSLVAWSDSGKLFPLFNALPHKAYIYSANGKRKKDVVPRLSEPLTHEVSASGHALMSDNPTEFYVVIARIIRDSTRRTNATKLPPKLE